MFIKPYHYALILVGGTTYFNVWYDFFTKEMLSEIRGKERSYLLIKTMLTFRPLKSKLQMNDMIDVLLEHHNPGIAVLLDYYFSEIITSDQRKIINYLISEVEFNRIEMFVADFEEKTRDFFRDVNAILKK